MSLCSAMKTTVIELGDNQVELERKAVLQQIVEKYEDVDLNGVIIDIHRIPEIVGSLVKTFDSEELENLLNSFDQNATGKVDLSRAAQIIIYFLKKEAERKKETFLKVTLKISTQICISEDNAIILYYFYPQIIKALDENKCFLQ